MTLRQRGGSRSGTERTGGPAAGPGGSDRRAVAVRLGIAAVIVGVVVAAVTVIVDVGAGTGGDATPRVAPPVPARPAPAPGPARPAGPPGIGEVTGALFDSARGAFASHFDNSGDDGLVEYGPRPVVVASPRVPGRQAYLMSLGPGGKRSEVLPVGPGTRPRDGESQFVRYSAVLSPDFPTGTPEFQIILQWHHESDDGSPPLALQVADGRLMMVSGGDDARDVGPIGPGGRVDLTMNIRFSESPGDASVTVWRDGRPSGVSDWHPQRGTMFTPTAYLKMGMYRSRKIDQGGAVTIDDLKIGPTAASIGGIGPLAPR